MIPSRFIDPIIGLLTERDGMPDETRITAVIAEEIGCVKRHAIALMSKLKADGRAHICGYVDRYGREASPAWRLGAGEDAPHPGNKVEKPPRDWRQSVQLVRAAAWLEAGNKGTAKQIGKAVHADETNVSNGMKLMIADEAVVVVEIGKNGRRTFAWATDETRCITPKRRAPVKLSVYRRNKHKQLAKEHGPEIAREISRRMWGKDRSPVKIVIDGKVIYSRRSRKSKQNESTDPRECHV